MNFFAIKKKENLNQETNKEINNEEKKKIVEEKKAVLNLLSISDLYNNTKSFPVNKKKNTLIQEKKKKKIVPLKNSLNDFENNATTLFLKEPFKNENLKSKELIINI
jgi:hypothetical protein